MDRLTYLNNGTASYINSLYEAYQHDPGSVEFGWQKFFEGFDFGSHGEPLYTTMKQASSVEVFAAVIKEINVLNLIDAYRTRGHLFAKTNPVRERRKHYPEKN
ncbi:hypothetical protein [Niastella sp. OAS944]|uniref:2-oxoglutarate dehydrogenase E1 subunit family protein n=1 Tax=Niastella sp. OAS944 TaxID=2664089 RepID=UPI0034752A74|nr:2-oxoglutarate dehydrogenase complex dehydrogenase (E1) component-like enzyme [Chitinophagaceae bacterium OAS944]